MRTQFWQWWWWQKWRWKRPRRRPAWPDLAGQLQCHYHHPCGPENQAPPKRGGSNPTVFHWPIWHRNIIRQAVRSVSLPWKSNCGLQGSHLVWACHYFRPSTAPWDMSNLRAGRLAAKHYTGLQAQIEQNRHKELINRAIINKHKVKP